MNGDRLDCSFKYNKKHGLCKITFADGEIMEGNFHKDKKHGVWVITHVGGDTNT